MKNRIEFLNAKKFFSKFTFARRQIYYSTRIDSNEELIEAVKKSKLYWMKKKLQIEDIAASNNIKRELLMLKNEANGLSIEQKTILHSTNESKRLKLLRVGKTALN